MTQTYIDEIPPAVRPGMEGKFLTFRPLKYNHRPPAPRNLGYFFKFHSSDVKLIKWLLEDNGIREGNKNWIML